MTKLKTKLPRIFWQTARAKNTCRPAILFRYGHYIYACDGSMAVRTPARFYAPSAIPDPSADAVFPTISIHDLPWSRKHYQKQPITLPYLTAQEAKPNRPMMMELNSVCLRTKYIRRLRVAGVTEVFRVIAEVFRVIRSPSFMEHSPVYFRNDDDGFEGLLLPCRP